MSVLALVASGLLIWSLVLNAVYGNVFYDTLFTVLGLFLLASALTLRAFHRRRQRLERQESGREEVSMVVACAREEEKDGREEGKEGAMEKGVGLATPCRGWTGDNRPEDREEPETVKEEGGEGGEVEEGERKKRSGRGRSSETGPPRCLEEALLPLPPSPRPPPMHGWLLALRVKERHYMPVLGGETQVGTCAARFFVKVVLGGR
jgi:hypothetical protein